MLFFSHPFDDISHQRLITPAPVQAGGCGQVDAAAFAYSSLTFVGQDAMHVSLGEKRVPADYDIL